MVETEEKFSKQMRKATRDIHKLSDTLVNAKIFFALNSRSVWAEGLLIFYEIFKFLEENVEDDILPLKFHRKDAFEKDLNFYLGSDWKSGYSPRQEVQSYLNHLKTIKEENPILLMAYVYHLYMGLLSGGQILQSKRKYCGILDRFLDIENSTMGQELTSFEYPIYILKKEMRDIVDVKAEALDKETKEYLIEESRLVFILNNKIIRTVQNANYVNIKRLGVLISLIILIFLIYRVL